MNSTKATLPSVKKTKPNNLSRQQLFIFSPLHERIGCFVCPHGFSMLVQKRRVVDTKSLSVDKQTTAVFVLNGVVDSSFGFLSAVDSVLLLV